MTSHLQTSKIILRNSKVIFLSFFLLCSNFYMIQNLKSLHILITSIIFLSSILIGIYFLDFLIKGKSLKAFNTALLGLFLGYILGHLIISILSTILSFNDIKNENLNILNAFIFVLSLYAGYKITIKSANEFSISIPFIKFSPIEKKKKDILIDSSILTDKRIIDIANTGFLNNHLVIPRFIINTLYSVSDETEQSLENEKNALETLKKLEEMPGLNIRYIQTNFPKIKTLQNKLIQLAKLLNANILTSDMSKVQTTAIEDIKIISLNSIYTALKPITETGEILNIKIQRYGKEPKQGIGYLEDGTMVVVNGGGDFISENIKVQVLSVKHTSSGRMVFCNTLEQMEVVQYE